MNTPTFITFLDQDEEGQDCVGLVMQNAVIDEYEGELCPGGLMSQEQARLLAEALLVLCDRMSE